MRVDPEKGMQTEPFQLIYSSSQNLALSILGLQLDLGNENRWHSSFFLKSMKPLRVGAA